MAYYDENDIEGLPYPNQFSNLSRDYNQNQSYPGLGAGLVSSGRPSLGGNTFQRPNGKSAIQNALTRFDQSFQQVNLPQRSLNNATDFGVPGSTINRGINTAVDRFDTAFQNSNSIFGRYY